MAGDIFLNVITKNESALALYHSVGFREFGLVEDTFSVEGEFYSEYRMSKRLLNRPKLADRSGQ